MLQSLATSIVRTLRQRGYQAYLVGGCVRDLLLGREPADYDVATDATPDEVMRIFPETYAVGAQFGVVLVPLPRQVERELDGVARSPSTGLSADPAEGGRATSEDHPVIAGHHHAVEVATFRSDVGYSDGRHPDQVRFSKSAQEDVQRRDFTINGLLLDPVSGPAGENVIDYVGGRRDLD